MSNGTVQSWPFAANSQQMIQLNSRVALDRINLAPIQKQIQDSNVTLNATDPMTQQQIRNDVFLGMSPTELKGVLTQFQTSTFQSLDALKNAIKLNQPLPNGEGASQLGQQLMMNLAYLSEVNPQAYKSILKELPAEFAKTMNQCVYDLKVQIFQSGCKLYFNRNENSLGILNSNNYYVNPANLLTASQKNPVILPSRSPVATQPVTTQPGATQPVTTQPVTTQPGATQPGATQPVTTQPGATQPGATQPGATQPGATQPGATQPVTTQPGATQPGATQPVTTQPGATQPVTTQPGTTQPAATGSMQSILASLNQASSVENINSILKSLNGTNPDSMLSRTIANVLKNAKPAERGEFINKLLSSGSEDHKKLVIDVIAQIPAIGVSIADSATFTKLLSALQDKPVLLAKMIDIKSEIISSAQKDEMVNAFKGALAKLEGKPLPQEDIKILVDMASRSGTGSSFVDALRTHGSVPETNNRVWNMLADVVNQKVSPQQAKASLQLNEPNTQELSHIFAMFAGTSAQGGTTQTGAQVLERLSAYFLTNSVVPGSTDKKTLEQLEKMTAYLYQQFDKNNTQFQETIKSLPPEVQTVVKQVMEKIKTSDVKIKEGSQPPAFDGGNASQKIQDIWGSALYTKPITNENRCTPLGVAKAIHDIRSGNSSAEDKKKALDNLLSTYAGANMDPKQLAELTKLFKDKNYDLSKISHSDLANVFENKTKRDKAETENPATAQLNGTTYTKSQYNKSLAEIQKKLLAGDFQGVSHKDMLAVLAFARSDGSNEVVNDLQNLVDRAKDAGKLTEAQARTLRDSWGSGLQEVKNMSPDDVVNKYGMERLMLPGAILTMQESGKPFKKEFNGFTLLELSRLAREDTKTLPDNRRQQLRIALKELSSTIAGCSKANGLSLSNAQNIVKATIGDWDQSHSDGGKASKFSLTKMLTEEIRDRRECLLEKAFNDPKNLDNAVIHALVW